MVEQPQSSEPRTPWRADAEIDVERVARILAEDQPELRVERITPLGEGWSSFVFLVDDRWVLRFPKRRDVERCLEKEIRILPKLNRHLPIAVPDITIVGKPSEHFPFTYVGYEKLDGVFAWDLDDEIGQEALARSLGEALTSLHAFSIKEASASGCEQTLERIDEASCEEVRRLFARVPPWAERALFEQSLERYLNTLPLERLRPPGQVTLTHADLLPDHILVPSASNLRVSAIIDWGETRIGDPAADFAGLFYWRGREFTEHVLAHYSGPVQGEVIERARFMALPVGIGDIWYGLEAGRPEYLRIGLACVRHCLVMPR